MRSKHYAEVMMSMSNSPTTEHRLSKRVAAAMRAVREARGLTPGELATRLNEIAPTVLEVTECASRSDKDGAWVRAIEDDSIPIYLTDIDEFAGAVGITPIEFLDRVWSAAVQVHNMNKRGSSECAR